MKQNVVDFRAYRRRKVEHDLGYRACGWRDLRAAVTDASRAVNHLVPLHLVTESEIIEVADRLARCQHLALAMVEKGRQHGK